MVHVLGGHNRIGSGVLAGDVLRLVVDPGLQRAEASLCDGIQRAERARLEAFHAIGVRGGARDVRQTAGVDPVEQLQVLSPAGSVPVGEGHQLPACHPVGVWVGRGASPVHHWHHHRPIGVLGVRRRRQRQELLLVGIREPPEAFQGPPVHEPELRRLGQRRRDGLGSASQRGGEEVVGVGQEPAPPQDARYVELVVHQLPQLIVRHATWPGLLAQVLGNVSKRHASAKEPLRPELDAVLHGLLVEDAGDLALDHT
mmetsp:Transcript_19270/g.55991  ORF Transcript_19270/g.55991 Transcript_19270/m.55991 type:complete len:256 (-) Transcript_19270:2263-3030(-)